MPTNNAKLKGIWNIREVNAYMAEWKISSPPPPFTFQNAPPPLARSTLLHKTCDSSILTDSWRFVILRGLSDFVDLYTTNNSF